MLEGKVIIIPALGGQKKVFLANQKRAIQTLASGTGSLRVSAQGLVSILQ